jgi:hypothetical protein
VKNWAVNKEGTKKAGARILLLVALTTLWAGALWREAAPNRQIAISGALIGVEIPESKATTPGINTIKTLLHGEKANRLHHSRNLQEIAKEPRAMQERGPLKPLLVIEAKGPGNIRIQGNGPTGTITFPLAKTNQKYLVYPRFGPWKSPKKQEEILRFEFQGQRGSFKTIAKEDITWSDTRSLFLAEKSLLDLAALTAPIQKGTTAPKDPNQWIQNQQEQIQSWDLTHEPTNPIGGWQSIRTEEEIRQTKKANCLDLALLFAINAKKAGLTPDVLIGDGHALCTIAETTKTPRKKKQEIVIETTERIKPQKTPPAQKSQPKPPPPKEEAHGIFRAELPRWEPFFKPTAEKNAQNP